MKILFSRLLRSSSSSSSAAPGLRQPTAAALVIGDEILNGKVMDTNTHLLAKTLWSCGVKMTEVAVIPDDLDTIAQYARRLSASNDFVVTSGGIGTTHDDKTYEALAKAFGLSRALHQPTVEKMAVFYREKRNSPIVDLKNDTRLLMALLPDPCDVLETPGTWVPTAVINKNIYVLPGVPWIYQEMLKGSLEPVFRQRGVIAHRRIVLTRLWESVIAVRLGKVQEDHPSVQIGSYPRKNEKTGDFEVRLSVEGLDKAEVEKVTEQLCGLFEAHIINQHTANS